MFKRGGKVEFREAHNLKVVGSKPTLAKIKNRGFDNVLFS